MRRAGAILAFALASCVTRDMPADERCLLTREQSPAVGACDMEVLFLYDPELGCCFADSGCGCLDNDCGEFFMTTEECEQACGTDSLCHR